MSSSSAQTLQKLYFTILGVPMDVQLQDVFAKKVDAEGWGWLNSIINDYLGFLASTTSHSSVINMLAKNGWGLQMSAADLAFWGTIVKDWWCRQRCGVWWHWQRHPHWRHRRRHFAR